MNISKHILLVLSMLMLVFARSVQSQSYILSNPAQIHEVQSSFVNPAIISFQGSQVIVGSKILQFGFLNDNEFAIKNSFASVIFPQFSRFNLTTGLQGNSLHFPIFTENMINLVSSLQLTRGFSIGVQLGMLSKSFNQDKFDLVDKNDPVFAGGTSKNVLNIGAGLFFRPLSNLKIGLGVNHLNEPDISFVDDNIRQPMALNGGISFTPAFWKGGHWETSIGFRSVEDELFPVFSLSAHPGKLGILQMNYSKYDAEFQTQIFTHRNFAFDYKFSYPLSELREFSNFSHQVSMVIRFKSSVQFEVSSTINSMDIHKKHMIRHVDENVSEKELSGMKIQKFMHVQYNRVEIGSINEFRPYLNHYRNVLHYISNKLNNNSSSKLRIMINRGQERLAVALLKFAIDSLYVSPAQLEYGYKINDNNSGNLQISKSSLNNREIALSDNLVTFNITHLLEHYTNGASHVRTWRFLIISHDKQIVKRYRGSHTIPEKITWNWLSESSQLITPGCYYYILGWVDLKGKAHFSQKRKLYVNKSSKKRILNISKQIPSLQEGSGIFELVLGD